MKQIAILCGVALLGGALSAAPVLAGESQTTEKTVTTTTTTTSSGTVSQFGPDAIVIKGSGSTAPVTYQYTKTTTYGRDHEAQERRAGDRVLLEVGGPDGRDQGDREEPGGDAGRRRDRLSRQPRSSRAASSAPYVKITSAPARLSESRLSSRQRS